MARQAEPEPLPGVGANLAWWISACDPKAQSMTGRVADIGLRRPERGRLLVRKAGSTADSIPGRGPVFRAVCGPSRREFLCAGT